MIPLHADLLGVLDAVCFESRTSFRVLAASREVASGTEHSLSPQRPTRVVDALADEVYARLYCRPISPEEIPVFDELACRDHTSAIAAANGGRGTWEAGWTLRAHGADARLTVAKGEVHFVATRDGVRFPPGPLALGGPCSVRVPKELRCLVPGFYMALGDGDHDVEQAEKVDGPLQRFYWHLTPEAAAPFIAATTSLLNASKIPFQAKVLSDPNGYTRADAGVLYLQPGVDSRIGAIVSAIHQAVAGLLRPSVPLFTRQIALGLGYAEDPGGALSFGQDRCRIVAEAIWDAFHLGHVERDDRAATVASTFRARGLDPLRPHLGPGARAELTFDLAGISPEPLAAKVTTRGTASRADLGGGDPVQATILDAARRIGDALCREAHWDREGRYCNWIGRSMTFETGTAGGLMTRAAALGSDLYGGSAGVALYLAQLYTMTRDVEHRRTSLAAIARSIRQLERTPSTGVRLTLSLFQGDLGVAWAARRVATLTAESSLTVLANALFERIVATATRPHHLDLMGGSAGAIPVLLKLGADLGLESYRELATRLGEELCQAALCEGRSCCWDPVRASGPGIATTPLSGLSHGAAGIGLALFELYAATGRLEFRDLARRAFAFEDSQFDPGKGNWPDNRTSAKPNAFARAWCHGAPGMALTRLRAATLDPDQAPGYLEKARIALTTTLDTIDAMLVREHSDSSLCHGLAGLGEIALIAGQHLGDRSCQNRAFSLASALIERHGSTGNWPSGILPARGPNPSLMLGLAGVGYWLLRLRSCETVPSVLLFTT
jgi:lantibiotic biosynthesis protein